jgi:hypothetical protein
MGMMVPKEGNSFVLLLLELDSGLTEFPGGGGKTRWLRLLKLLN